MADDADPLRSPLAAFAGRVPAAPDWFVQAMADAPDRGTVPLRGGTIETLSWGDPAKPGLLLMHGSAAHADIWCPFAPFLASSHRVVAFSWPGMGRSSWRDVYDFDEMAEDIVAITMAVGLFDQGPPTLIAHSMGGAPTMLAVRDHGGKFAGAIIVDTPFSPSRDRFDGGKGANPEHPHRLYPTQAAALARFRFAPTQPSPNPYLTDMVARASLEEVEDGWRWRFDPGIRKRLARAETWDALAVPKCRLAFVTGEKSGMIVPLMDAVMEQVPAGTPHVVIPDAHHHLIMDQPIAFVSALRAILGCWGTLPAKRPRATPPSAPCR